MTLELPLPHTPPIQLHDAWRADARPGGWGARTGQCSVWARSELKEHLSTVEICWREVLKDVFSQLFAEL